MHYDILSIEEQATTLKIAGNEVSSRKKSNIQRYGVRRFENEKVFQTSRLGKATTDRLIADTKEWGGLGSDHLYGFSPAHKEDRTSDSVNSSVLESFEEGLKTLVRLHPDFIFSGRCTAQNNTTSMQSSYGLDLKTSGGICDWYYMYQRKGSSNMMDGYFGDTSSKTNIHDLIERHSKFLNVQGKTVKIANGRMPVLLVDNQEPLKKLIESFYINKYEEGAALYSGKLGEKLFSDKNSLVDNSYDASSGNFNFFDGDGIVRNEDLKLIDQGRFVSTISDLRFSKKFGKTSTGNGLRAYNRGTNLSLKSLRFAKGKIPWQSIINNLDRCLVAMVAAGGDSNDLGEYSTPVQIGYILEKGEIVGQAPQVTIKTSVDKYLGKDLIDVSSDGFTPAYHSACVISEMEVFVN